MTCGENMVLDIKLGDMRCSD